MNKPRSHRMQRVADIAGYHTDQAANVMAQRLREIDLAQNQLRELQQFRRDYSGTEHTGTEPTRSAGDLLNYQRFMARIDAAIAQQHEEVERRLQGLATARAAWVESRSRSSALETVSQRYRNQERASEERIEQAVADEHAQRQTRRWGCHDQAKR